MTLYLIFESILCIFFLYESCEMYAKRELRIIIIEIEIIFILFRENMHESIT